MKRQSCVLMGAVLVPLSIAAELSQEGQGFLSNYLNKDGHVILPKQAEENAAIVSNETEQNELDDEDDWLTLIGWAGDSSDSSNTNERPFPTCRVSFNVSQPSCAQHIARSGRSDCECYSFCGGDLVGCVGYGDDVPPFSCPSQDVMVGCQENTTKPDIEQSLGIDRPCPRGYICSKYEQQSCELVRQIPIWLGLGDVHAGLSCPGRDDRVELGYQNCDAGYYCPNSTSRVPCPAGYFCPHKTEKPEILCSGCPEASMTLRREPYVYTIGLFAFALLLVGVLWVGFQKYHETSSNQLNELQTRYLDGINDVGYKRKHLRKMKALRPKLNAIERRLKNQYGINLDLVGESEDGKVSFNADVLFDALDSHADDILAYKKLNKVLQLNPMQLREFIRRMNGVAGEYLDTEQVERHVFVTQFLSIFGAIDHLDPTPEDAAALFDEIAKQGTTKTGEIPHRFFFSSRLTDFLSEEQINTMLKDFQRTTELHEGSEHLNCTFPTQGDIEDPKVKEVPLAYSRSFFGIPERGFSVARGDFIARYPTLLADATKSTDKVKSMIFSSQLTLHRGMDLAFEKLSVSIPVKDRPVKVIQNVTGRLCVGTMTALMGGPRSGKRSLLAAMGGRLVNGSVAGRMFVNGHNTSISNHSEYVGYVSKDEVLYSELTVREHLIYSAKFRLSEVTMEEIEDLAELTMARFNLSCSMHTPVGEPGKGGLSALQRRCLSIGMEVMAQPRILFLERPALDIDNASGLFIARVMKKLVDTQGLTVCSILHQPRRECLEIFDSLMLLGVGGKFVYNGPVTKIGKYFRHLNYYLHEGESITDWLIDIASGSLTPPVRKVKRDQRKAVVSPRNDGESRTTETTGESSGLQRQPSVKRVMFEIAGQVVPVGETESIPCIATKPFANTQEKAKATCELLSGHLREYVKGLTGTKHAQYAPPQPYSLPKKRDKDLLSQLGSQLSRMLIITERSWFSRFFDTTIIIVAVLIVTLIDGIAQPTKDQNMRSLQYENIAKPVSAEALLLEFPTLFDFAITGIRDDITLYATKVGLLFAVTICITTATRMAKQRSSLLREANAGYSVGAFFFAANVLLVMEHAMQAILASMLAFCFRSSLGMWYAYMINFLLLAWVGASWGVLFPLLIPSTYMTTFAALFIVFFGLLFCGTIAPMNFEAIYDGIAAALASGLLSPIRFFVEGMAVAEARCLPGQSGFTDLGMNIQGGALEVASFRILSYGLNDFGTITKQSWQGWYWGAFPSLLVGASLRWLALLCLYATTRNKQMKKSILVDPNRRIKEAFWFAFCTAIQVGLIAGAVYFILLEKS